MTGFAIGMLAAAMWLGVMVAVWYLFKTAPGHPFRSIRSFRTIRRTFDDPKIKQVASHPVVDESDTQAVEPFEAEPVADHEISRMIDLATLEVDPEVPVSLTDFAAHIDPGLESDDIGALLESVTSQRRSRKPGSRRKPLVPRSGPVTVGRTTYVLVDDEGRPQV